MPLIADRIRVRLGQLSRWLGGGDWLDGAFSAGDLMMVFVLDEFTNLPAYVARGEARPRTSVRLRRSWPSMRGS